MSNARFVQLTTTDEVDAIFAPGEGPPVVVFLDDPGCPISAAARRRVARLDREVLTIDVSRRGDLSRQIATRTGIRHESPQAFVVSDGVPLWNASHGAISDVSVTRALAAIAGAAPIAGET